MKTSAVVSITTAVAIAGAAGGFVASNSGPGAHVMGVKIEAATNASNGNGNGAGNGVGAPSASDKKTFTIAGSATQLYPGVSNASVSLLLTNDSNFVITVNSLTVTAAAASTSCAASNILLGPSATPGSATFDPSVSVPRGASSTYQLAISMPFNAPDSCKNSTFNLTYSGSAVKA